MRFALSLAAAFFLLTMPAHAALKLCNRTSYVLYAATAISAPPHIVTEGWTRIAPGDCATAIAGALTAPAYYVTAQTSQGHAGRAHVWGGESEFCARDGNFTLATQTNVPGCGSDNFFPMPFAKIDTKAMKSWVTTFTESPNIKTLPAARDAGITRLLSDIGYKDDHATALKKFSARMKLPDSASTDDLFSALETEALKVAAPAGYSICNDSESTIWAALGLKTGANWLTRGWWKVMPGSCARAITDPLTVDKVYLHVEGHGNHNLVSGADMLCVTDITFEVTSKGDCAGQGLTAIGFATTGTKGRSGYAAHVGEDGLVPQMTGAAQASTPK